MSRCGCVPVKIEVLFAKTGNRSALTQGSIVSLVWQLILGEFCYQGTYSNMEMGALKWCGGACGLVVIQVIQNTY